MAQHQGFRPIIRYVNPPNLMTSASILVGMAALWLIAQQHIKIGIAVYSVTFLLDTFDGIVAKKLNLSSDFGGQLDSLADVLNFCAIPVAITYAVGQRSWWLLTIAAFYILCGVWRLALYNVVGLNEDAASGRRFFSGIPTPHAAAWFVIVLALCHLVPLPAQEWVLAAFFLIAALLMTHSFQYPKFGVCFYALWVLEPLAVLVIWVRA